MERGPAVARFVFRRLLAVVPVLIIVGVVSFTIIHLTPGNPAQVILGENADPGQVARLNHELGLDAPLWQQFLSWSGRAIHGDLGASIFYGQPVLGVVVGHLRPTAYEAVLATLLSLVVAWPAGLIAAWKRKSFLDRLFMSVSLLGVSIPSFWLGLMLIVVFSVSLGWLPVTGYTAPSSSPAEFALHLILPVVVLAASQAAIIARMLRDGVIDSLTRPYIRTARAKGAAEESVLLGHAMPNALVPTLTVVGSSLATLLSGVVVVEVVFNIPGIGNLIIQAIQNRDYPLVEGIALMFALIYVGVNVVVDLSYALVDPRIRYQ